MTTLSTPDFVRACDSEMISHQNGIDVCRERDDLTTRLAAAESRLAEVEAENVRLVKVDFPELDATDAAHPAWWRGHDHGAESICREALRILDGGEIHGSCAEPWETVRQRIKAMRERLALLDDATALTPEIVMAMLPNHKVYPLDRHGMKQIQVDLGDRGFSFLVEADGRVSDGFVAIPTVGRFRHWLIGHGVEWLDTTTTANRGEQ